MADGHEEFIEPDVNKVHDLLHDGCEPGYYKGKAPDIGAFEVR